MNEILLSDRKFWENKMKKMLSGMKLKESYNNPFEQIALFQILSQFLTIQEISFNVLQVIQIHLIKMLEIGNTPPSMADERWQEGLKKTMAINGVRFLEYIKQLRHGK